MSEKPQSCNICLKNSPNLVRASETDSNNVKWSCKLQFCVPEVEWHENWLICNLCIEQLDAACSFRNLCLQTSIARKRLANWRKYKTSVEPANSENSSEVCENDNKDAANGNCNFECTYTCYLCNETFPKKQSLIEHIQSHSENYCNVCKEEFTTSTQLKLHNVQAHREKVEDANVCQFCGKTFKSLVSLNRHIRRMHHVKQAHHCEDSAYSTVANTINKINGSLDSNCLKIEEYADKAKMENIECSAHSLDVKLKVDETFDDFNNDEGFNPADYNPDPNCEPMSNHDELEIEQKPELKSLSKVRKLATFFCEECHNVFLSSKKLLAHAVSTHGFDPSLVKPFRCDECNRKFSTSSNLLQHKKYHTGQRTHICTFCGKGYITKSDLNTHEKQHLNKREYQCINCPKTFNTNKDLRSHRLVVHTDPGLWNYVCTFCQKRFPIKSNLDQHMRRHTGEKRFGCHICEKRFVDKIVLQKHIKSHSNFRAFKCGHCKKEYKDHRVLEVHLTKVHGIGNAKIPVRVKKYFCHECPKSYFAKNKLTRHMFSHTGEKPYVCHICQRKFTDMSYVKQHLKTTHNVFEMFENKFAGLNCDLESKLNLV